MRSADREGSAPGKPLVMTTHRAMGLGFTHVLPAIATPGRTPSGPDEFADDGVMVSAQETNLQAILEGTKQYQVPLYQRTYSWTRKQLQRLWTDLETLAEDRRHNPKATHFIGSLVLAPSPANGPAGVSRFLVVDGQQRLTTLTILLAAIRDHHRDHLSEPQASMRFEQINETFLINKFETGRNRHKLLPTQGDRPLRRDHRADGPGWRQRHGRTRLRLLPRATHCCGRSR